MTASPDDPFDRLARRLHDTPADAAAHADAAELHIAAGRFDRAAAHLRVAIAAEPSVARRWSALAAVLVVAGRAVEARAAAERALGMDDRLADAWTALGQLDVQAGHAERGRTSFERALGVRPDFAPARLGIGTALECLGRLEEALDAYQRVLELDPTSAEAHYRMGVLHHRHWGDIPRAVAQYREAIARQPRHASAHHNLSHALLLLGQLPEAWREHAWRPPRLRHEAMLARQGARYAPPAWPLPAGARLAILPEQGLGDTLFFLRFAAAARAAGGTLEFVGDARLHPMLQRTGTFGGFAQKREELPPADRLEILAGDLPLLAPDAGFAPSVSLRPSEPALRAARERLQALGPAPYIGVAWRAGETGAGSQETLLKEVPVGPLGRALAKIPATWIVVQREPSPHELRDFGASLGQPVHDLSTINADLELALAVMQAMDDYVGVSSTLVHLRAATAKAGHILVPHPPDWKWLAEGVSPWFPSMRPCRQARGGDWSEALRQLARELARVSS